MKILELSPDEIEKQNIKKGKKKGGFFGLSPDGDSSLSTTPDDTSDSDGSSSGRGSGIEAFFGGENTDIEEEHEEPAEHEEPDKQEEPDEQEEPEEEEEPEEPDEQKRKAEKQTGGDIKIINI